MKRKLIKGFGLVVLINIIAGIIVFFQFKIFERKITYIETELAPISEISTRLSTDINRIQVKLYKIKSRENIYIDTLINYVEDADDAVDKLMILNEITPKIKIVNSLSVTLEAFKSTISRIVTASDKDIIIKLDQKALEESLKIKELTDDLCQYANSNYIKEKKKAFILIRYYPGIFLIVLFFVILIAVYIIRTTVADISKPIDMLVEGTNQLAMGNLKHRININTEIDEIQKLSESFNDMASALENFEEKKTEAIKQLIVTIDHRIKNKVAGIITSIEVVLSESGSTNKEIQNIFSRIKESAEEINNIIDKLNNISKVTTTDYIDGIKMLDIE